MIEIVSRYTGAVLHSCATADDIAAALLEAVRGGADLRGANLGGADLLGATLYGANLGGAKGLLPGGIVPLQILGTRWPIIVRQSGFITIGCEHHEIAWWRENGEKLAIRESYTPAQIAEYRAHVDHCEQWMKAYGVDQVEMAKATEEVQS